MLNHKKILAVFMTGVLLASTLTAYADDSVSQNDTSVTEEDITEEQGEPEEPAVIEEDGEGYVFPVSVDGIVPDPEEDDRTIETASGLDVISDNEAEEEEKMDHLFFDEGELEEADEEFISAVKDVIADTKDGFVKAYTLSVPEDVEVTSPVTVEVCSEEIKEGREYYAYIRTEDGVKAVEFENYSYGTFTIVLDELTDIAVIEKDARLLFDQSIYGYIDGLKFTVEGEMPIGAKLSLEKLDIDDYKDLVKKETENKLSAIYDVKILDRDGKEWQPKDTGRSVTLSVSGIDTVHEGLTNMIHITEEGTVETVTPAVDTLFSTNELSCETDSFSPYGLADVTATTQLEEIADINISHIKTGETNHTIYKMKLTYGGTTADAFCLDLGKTARSGKTYTQDGAFNVKNILKILTVYDAGGYLDYVQAQVLVWAAQAGVTDREAVLQDLTGSHAMSASEITAALNAIDSVTNTNTYYTWKDTDDPSTYQRFLTKIGKAIDVTPPSPSVDSEKVSEMWQIGDNAYAYCVMDFSNATYGEGTLHICGFGDTWNCDSNHTFVNDSALPGGGMYGGGFNAPVGEKLPWYNYNYEYEYTPAGSSQVIIKERRYYLSIYNVVFDPDSNITGIGSYLLAGLNTQDETYGHEISVPFDEITYIGQCGLDSVALSQTDITINNARYIGTDAFNRVLPQGRKITSLTVNGNGTCFGYNIIDYTVSNARTHTDEFVSFRLNVKDPVYVRGQNLGSGVDIGAPVVSDTCNIAGTGTGGLNISIGPDTNVIPAYIFYRCSIINSLSFSPGSLTEIQESAFYDANMRFQTLVLPASLTTIGNRAFQGVFDAGNTSGLDTYAGSLEVSSNSQLTYIGDYAFCRMDNNALMAGLDDVPFESMTRLNTIGQYAFSGNPLMKNIYLPVSVTNIGTRAFSLPTVSSAEWLDYDKNNDGVNDREITYLSGAHSADMSDFANVSPVALAYNWDQDRRYIGSPPAPKYTITFDTDGGTPVPTTQYKEEGEKVDKPDDPEKDNYIFRRWVDQATSYTWSFDYDTVTGPLTLVAEYREKNNVTISFDSSDGGTPPDPITVFEHDTVYFPGQESMEKTGFDFLGWAYSEGSDYAGYHEGDTWDASYDHTFYAVWGEKVDYSIVLPVSLQLKKDDNGSYSSVLNISADVTAIPKNLEIKTSIYDSANTSARNIVNENSHAGTPLSLTYVSGVTSEQKRTSSNSNTISTIRIPAHSVGSYDYEYKIKADLSETGQYNIEDGVTVTTRLTTNF